MPKKTYKTQPAARFLDANNRINWVAVREEFLIDYYKSGGLEKTIWARRNGIHPNNLNGRIEKQEWLEKCRATGWDIKLKLGLSNSDERKKYKIFCKDLDKLPSVINIAAYRNSSLKAADYKSMILSDKSPSNQPNFKPSTTDRFRIAEELQEFVDCEEGLAGEDDELSRCDELSREDDVHIEHCDGLSRCDERNKLAHLRPSDNSPSVRRPSNQPSTLPLNPPPPSSNKLPAIVDYDLSADITDYKHWMKAGLNKPWAEKVGYIMENLQKGMTLSGSLELATVQSTAFDWLRNNVPEINARYRQTVRKFELQRLQKIDAHSDKRWDAAAWMLEKNPELGDRYKQDKNAGGINIVITVDRNATSSIEVNDTAIVVDYNEIHGEDTVG